MRSKADTPVKTLLGEGYVSETAGVNGTTLHYVRGGQGPAVILIHGFPQDWFEYHAIMPRLAKQFTVIAIDLRGVGGSAVAPDGYDAATMAGDVYQLALTVPTANLICGRRQSRTRLQIKCPDTRFSTEQS